MISNSSFNLFKLKICTNIGNQTKIVTRLVEIGFWRRVRTLRSTFKKELHKMMRECVKRED